MMGQTLTNSKILVSVLFERLSNLLLNNSRISNTNKRSNIFWRETFGELFSHCVLLLSTSSFCQIVVISFEFTVSRRSMKKSRKVSFPGMLSVSESKYRLGFYSVTLIQTTSSGFLNKELPLLLLA